MPNVNPIPARSGAPNSPTGLRVVTIPTSTHRAGTLATRLAAAVAFTVGVVHLMLTQEHFAKATWVGAAFAAGGVALLYTAWELAQRWNPLAWLTGGFTLVTMFGFGIASRTVGIPGFPIAKWSPALITSLALEALFFVLLLASLRTRSAGSTAG